MCLLIFFYNNNYNNNKFTNTVSNGDENNPGGWSFATATTTQQPTAAPSYTPNKSANNPADKLSLRKPHYVPPIPPSAPILPIIGGQPAKIVNPYINIAFSPEVSVRRRRSEVSLATKLRMSPTIRRRWYSIKC